MLFRLPLALLLLCLAACTGPVPVPDNDTDPPNFVLRIVDSQNESEIVVRSDEPLAGAECPPGTNRAGQAMGNRVTDVTNTPIRFRLTTGDLGGVSSVYVQITDPEIEVTNLTSAPTSATATVETRLGSTFIEVDLAQSLYAQTLDFTLTSSNDAIILDAGADDQSGNRAELVPGAVRRFQAFDRSRCD